MAFDLKARLGRVVTLVRVEIRERAIASFYRSSGSYTENAKGQGLIGKHDYIILTVRDTNDQILDLVVEKREEEASFCGWWSCINVVPMSEHPFADKPSRRRFVWPLHEQQVWTEELIEALESTGHGYHFLFNNCWRYATSTVKAILKLCLHYASPRHGNQNCFKNALWELKEVKRGRTFAEGSSLGFSLFFHRLRFPMILFHFLKSITR